MIFNYQAHSKKSGIYKITNIRTGRFYYGSCKEFKSRWKGHATSLRNGKHHNQFLQNDYNKCKEEIGNDDFLIFEVIDVMEASTKKERTDREQVFVDKFHDKCDVCYNIRKDTVATDSSCFSKNPEETRKKLKEAQVKLWSNEEFKRESTRKMSEGKREALKDPEYRKELGEAISNAKKDSISLISQQAKERWADPEYRKRVVAKQKEVGNTPEARAKKRETQRKIKEQREQDPEKLAEFKKKMSEHAKKIWEQGLIKVTEESRKNMSESAKKRIAEGRAPHLAKTSFKNKYQFTIKKDDKVFIFTDITKQARELNLALYSLKQLCYGQIKNHKGYTLTKKEEIK